MLEISGLSKTYVTGRRGTVRALEGVSLSVAAGEFVAVQGPSGCGKTTLLLSAGTLLAPSQGGVRIDGQDPYAMSPENRASFRASRIGFVFQQFHLIPYLSVEENIAAPALAFPQADARERARELMEQAGLADRARHVPAELSIGERQRTALARALLNRPNFVLADEPTGNLDAANAEMVLGRLADFSRGGGVVLLVTHDVRAAAYAHRTVYMERGALV